MKKIICLILITAFVLTAKAQEMIINDPNAVLRTVSSFNAIEVSSAINVYLNQANNETLAVSAKNTEDRDRIKTEVSNGTLKIWFNDKGIKWKSGDKKMKVYIAFKNLTSIKSSGASDVFVNGKLGGDLLQLDFSGASDFKGEISVKKLTVHITGASDTYFKGDTQLLEVDASGASDFKGYDLTTEKCEAKASGASSIKITVNKDLSAKASGASNVYYKGSGVISSIQSSGASSVVKKD